MLQQIHLLNERFELAALEALHQLLALNLSDGGLRNGPGLHRQEVVRLDASLPRDAVLHLREQAREAGRVLHIGTEEYGEPLTLARVAHRAGRRERYLYSRDALDRRLDLAIVVVGSVDDERLLVATCQVQLATREKPAVARIEPPTLGEDVSVRLGISVVAEADRSPRDLQSSDGILREHVVVLIDDPHPGGGDHRTQAGEACRFRIVGLDGAERAVKLRAIHVTHANRMLLCR